MKSASEHLGWQQSGKECILEDSFDHYQVYFAINSNRPSKKPMIQKIRESIAEERNTRRFFKELMKSQPKPITDLVRPNEIERLALPSNFRYGTAIYKRGGVEIIEYSSLKVEGWVGGLDGSVAEGGSQRRRTQLISTPEGLQWRCTGNPKDHQIFCKHCVALAMAIWDRSHLTEEL